VPELSGTIRMVTPQFYVEDQTQVRPTSASGPRLSR
jgi:hypothetical protein